MSKRFIYTLLHIKWTCKIYSCKVYTDIYVRIYVCMYTLQYICMYCRIQCYEKPKKLLKPLFLLFIYPNLRRLLKMYNYCL